MKRPLIDYIQTGTFGDDHYGIDYAVPEGTPVLACADGRVISAGPDATGYGQLMVLEHHADNMTYRSYYAHLSKFNVKPGMVVLTGGVIAYSGNTGNSTGPHLHFEVRISPFTWPVCCLDPEPLFIPDDPVPPTEQSPVLAGRAVVTAEQLNVRRGPGMSSRVIGHLVSGDAVIVHGEPVQADGRVWRIIECYVCEVDADGERFLS